MKHIKLFESFLKESMEDDKHAMERFLEDFMETYNASYTVEAPGPGEYNLDSESHHPILTVWADLCMSLPDYQKAKNEIDEDYEKFAKPFVDMVKEINYVSDSGWEASILTRDEDNVVVFQLTTEY